MWICSTLGYFSIKKNEKATDEWFIRAREARDLKALRDAVPALDGLEINDWKGADYRFRLIVDKAGLSAVFAALAESITYSNFKGQIACTPSQRHKGNAYHRIWDVMANLQPTPPYAR